MCNVYLYICGMEIIEEHSVRTFYQMWTRVAAIINTLRNTMISVMTLIFFLIFFFDDTNEGNDDDAEGDDDQGRGGCERIP